MEHLSANGEVPQLDPRMDDVVTSAVDDQLEEVLEVDDVAEDEVVVRTRSGCRPVRLSSVNEDRTVHADVNESALPLEASQSARGRTKPVTRCMIVDVILVGGVVNRCSMSSKINCPTWNSDGEGCGCPELRCM